MCSSWITKPIGILLFADTTESHVSWTWLFFYESKEKEHLLLQTRSLWRHPRWELRPSLSTSHLFMPLCIISIVWLVYLSTVSSLSLSVLYSSLWAICKSWVRDANEQDFFCGNFCDSSQDIILRTLTKVLSPLC